jgi:mono/diheme cytochrome c family protein
MKGLGIMASMESFTDRIASVWHLSYPEAVDEVADAVEVLWAPEDRPAEVLTAAQAEAVFDYISDQYRSHRWVL